MGGEIGEMNVRVPYWRTWKYRNLFTTGSGLESQNEFSRSSSKQQLIGQFSSALLLPCSPAEPHQIKSEVTFSTFCKKKKKKNCFILEGSLKTIVLLIL